MRAESNFQEYLEAALLEESHTEISTRGRKQVAQSLPLDLPEQPLLGLQKFLLSDCEERLQNL